MKTQKFKIASAQSTIEWVGRKVTGAHNGTIALKGGELILSDDKLVGGHLSVDTNSIIILDIADPGANAQFAGHLASDDFFSSQQFPEATLEIISVSGRHVQGNLTIKGITNPISFDANVIVKGSVLTATAKIIIDRTKYAMKFRSGNFFMNLGDTLIYDDFELNVNLIASVEKKSLSILV
jgi:polyisoprenoid-binding protein YceI